MDLGELLPGPGEADLQPLDLAEPAFPFSFVDAGQEVVAHLFEPGALGGLGPEERASQVPLTELGTRMLTPVAVGP